MGLWRFVYSAAASPPRLAIGEAREASHPQKMNNQSRNPIAHQSHPGFDGRCSRPPSPSTGEGNELPPRADWPSQTPGRPATPRNEQPKPESLAHQPHPGLHGRCRRLPSPSRGEGNQLPSPPRRTDTEKGGKREGRTEIEAGMASSSTLMPACFASGREYGGRDCMKARGKTAERPNRCGARDGIAGTARAR